MKLEIKKTICKPDLNAGFLENLTTSSQTALRLFIAGNML